MKSLFQIVAGLAILMIGAVTLALSGNVLLAVGAMSVVAAAISSFLGVNIWHVEGLACTALVGLKRKCQSPTMGGAKRLYIVLTEDLVSEFLTYDMAKTTGEFAGPIPLVATKKFIEIEAWYDSTKFDTEMKIGAGFTQSIEFKVIGYDKDIVKVMSLLYEAPVNVVVQGNDDKLYWLGQKYIPMMFESKGVLPEKGTARKEVTFTAKQDGMQVPVFPLDAALTIEAAPLVA